MSIIFDWNFERWSRFNTHSGRLAEIYLSYPNKEKGLSEQCHIIPYSSLMCFFKIAVCKTEDNKLQLDEISILASWKSNTIKTWHERAWIHVTTYEPRKGKRQKKKNGWCAFIKTCGIKCIVKKNFPNKLVLLVTLFSYSWQPGFNFVLVRIKDAVSRCPF